MAATKSTRSRRASASKGGRTTKKSPAKSTRSTAKRATKSARKTAAKGTGRAQSTAKKAASSARKTTKRVTKAARKSAPSTRKSTGSPRSSRNGRRVDAIALLKQDHREVEEMFSRFEQAGKGATRRKEQLRDRIIEALSVHAVIEELVFYPAVREEVRGAGSTVLESLEEHHIVKVALRECEDMDPNDERFTAKMTVMMENVRHHVKEEERELFPQVRKAMDRARLVELAEALQQAKKTAPTRPHPYSPDEPPGNAIVGGAAAVVDRARKTGKQAVRRVRSEIPML